MTPELRADAGTEPELAVGGTLIDQGLDSPLGKPLHSCQTRTISRPSPKTLPGRQIQIACMLRNRMDPAPEGLIAAAQLLPAAI